VADLAATVSMRSRDSESPADAAARLGQLGYDSHGLAFAAAFGVPCSSVAAGGC
jgi:hypothetical protein